MNTAGQDTEDKMKAGYPDYDNSIVNMINSVLKHFGANYTHSTLPVMDALLEKTFRNVVIMVFDAMGSRNLMESLPEDSFLRQHMLAEITSVFPPTTTAATTTLESGLLPCEHAWLGWSLHFDEVQDNVNIYINTNDFGTYVADYHVATRYIPYKNVTEKINETGNARAESVSRFGTRKVKAFDELLEGVEDLCGEAGRHYIYTYWPEPDMSMHAKGVMSPEAIHWMNKIDMAASLLSKRLDDTLLIITADHGHIDGTNVCITDYEELVKTLRWLPSIEPRALAFYVKDGMNEAFEKEFKKNFREDFILFSRKDILKNKLFGDGNAHPRFEDFIGDYVAAAVGTRSVFNTKASCEKFIGVHAGLTEREMMVPFIAVECGQRTANPM